MPDPELKSCPFCGGQSQIRATTDRLPLYWVECYLCEIGTKWSDIPEGASKTWNTRASSLPEADLKLLREIYEHFDNIQDGAEDSSYADRMANRFVDPLERLIARAGGNDFEDLK